MIIILLPNVLSNHGLFLYAGDYAFQEIPFYYHASDYVKNNVIGWDWQTDLGSDFLTSYSFYLFGSLFFWILSRLSGMAVVYAMPVMIAFKTAVGALGAYLYIARYVKKEEAVFIGAYMYAFSGFQMTSLIFNHFHDVTALFPFLLLSFDLLVTENKKVFFAVMVAITALTNYFFFFGMVVLSLFIMLSDVL
ncbi:MAG: YfhO family protein [Oscillospiraceae bacterium]|nr:YfhO family protein [Oscillospiraceae bacterium]